MIFDHLKGKVKRDEDAGEGASNCPSKNKQRCEGLLMDVADHKGGLEARRGYPEPLQEAALRPAPEP